MYVITKDMQPSIPFYDSEHPSISLPLETVLKLHRKKGHLLPRHIPRLSHEFIDKNPAPSFRDVAFEVVRAFLQDAVPEADLYILIAQAFPFKVPVFPIDPRTYILELTHGDCGCCTDFGARLTAALINYFSNSCDKPLHILFTGGVFETMSLAKAFAGYPDIQATFLSPKGLFQEKLKQLLLSLPQNIHIFEVDGSAADCKMMVQEAARDAELAQALNLVISSPAHPEYLLSYISCCIYASLAVLSRASYDNRIEQPQLIIGAPLRLPNGISAAVIAKRMDAPICGFIATEAALGSASEMRYRKECTQLKRLYEGGADSGYEPDIALCRLNQDDILQAMRNCDDRTGCIISPHAAEIWSVWNMLRNRRSADHTVDILDSMRGLCTEQSALPRWITDKDTAQSCISIIPETSLPAFYAEAVKTATGRDTNLPYRHEYNPQSTRQPAFMQPSAQELKDWLLSFA